MSVVTQSTLHSASSVGFRLRGYTGQTSTDVSQYIDCYIIGGILVNCRSTTGGILWSNVGPVWQNQRIVEKESTPSPVTQTIHHQLANIHHYKLSIYWSLLDWLTTDILTDILIEAPYKKIRYSTEFMAVQDWNSSDQTIYRLIYVAIIEWGWVGYEEFCRSRRVLSTEVQGWGR